MSLYKKYRPSNFDDVIGNESQIESLKKTLSKGNPPQTYLFTGPSGCGKTTLARICARELGATDFSIREINSADNRGIDTARDIIEGLKYSLPGQRCRVFIIDELHMTTSVWQNAMLKPLEDTPKDTYFFLCTTDPGKLIKAIKTRCTEVKVNSLDSEDIYRLIKRISKKEELDVSKDILEEISENCDGSPRKAIVLLEKIAGLDNEKKMKEIISMGEETEAEVIELCRALLNGNWKEISGIIRELKETDQEKIRYAVLGYMNAVLLKSGKGQAGMVIENFSEPFYNMGKAGVTLAAFQSCQ